jgi:ABC-2 type transport system permease protein
MRRYAAVLRTAARRQSIYRAEIVMRMIQMVLFMCVFIALWQAIYGTSGRTALEGFTLIDMVWYLAMTETVVLSSSRVFTEISEKVKAGDVVYTLARPMSYPFYQVAYSLGGSVPRFVLNFVTGVVVVTVGTGRVAGSLEGLGAFLATAALALVLDALIAVLIGLLAFWIEEVTPAFWIYQKLLFTVGGLFLPLDLFPRGLERVARWLPFRFVTYVPARSFVAFDPGFVLRSMGGQVIYIAVLGALLVLMWQQARRRMVIHGG